MINMTINGKKVKAPEGSTILQAAKQNGIRIPTLCYLENIHKFGACRICVVEVEGAKTLQAACMVEAKDGMVIHTNSSRVRRSREVMYRLLMSDHPDDCLKCERNQSCELQALGKQLGITEKGFEGEKTNKPLDKSVSFTRDPNKCILCRRCVSVCNEIQAVGILNAQNRGFDTEISPAMGLKIGDAGCAMCGQCTIVCPVGALYETDATQKVWEALNDPNMRVVVQTAPAVRASIGEYFGMPAGVCRTGKLVAALHRMGFDDVFDTNWSADLTIMEEGTEFLQRVKNAFTGKPSVLPMITSCSPGWVKFAEHNFPEQLEHLSTCKSPHTMFGAVIKSYYAQKIGVEPQNIFVVSVMPCTAKKFEIERPEMQNDGNKNVDAVITVRELGDMINSAGIDFVSLLDEGFDSPLGFSTGAADIFGLTGGVMEAALRTVYELVTGRELPFPNLHVAPIVGLDEIKEGAIKIEKPLKEYSFLDGVEVKIAVTSGLKGARKLMQQVADGTSPYHFFEVMGCPGGCITGGGQPRTDDIEKTRKLRMQALYKEDEGKKLRKSHENPQLLEFYKEWGEPCSHRSHEYLHTHYVKRGVNNELTDESFVAK